MLERERLKAKDFKTNAVTSMIPYEMDPDNVHVGPSDHVPWLTDRKWAYIRMEGTTVGNVPSTWRSNSGCGTAQTPQESNDDACVAPRSHSTAELAGPIVGPSSTFKTPAQTIPR